MPTKQTNIENFKKRFNTLMAEKNLNLIQLENKLQKKIKRTTLSNYKKGNNFPEVEGCILLAKFFGVSVSYLLGETDIREADNKEIGERLGIDDETIKNLIRIKKFNEKNDIEYKNIIREVLTNFTLYKNLVNETNTIVKCYMDTEIIKQINRNLNNIESDLLENKDSSVLNIDDFIDIISCQRFLEVYHTYIDNELFFYKLSNMEKKELESKKQNLETELRKVNKELKDYENSHNEIFTNTGEVNVEKLKKYN